jgi:hypothetical protein
MSFILRNTNLLRSDSFLQALKSNTAIFLMSKFFVIICISILNTIVVIVIFPSLSSSSLPESNGHSTRYTYITHSFFCYSDMLFHLQNICDVRLGMASEHWKRKWCGNKLLWPVSRYRPIICHEGLQKEVITGMMLDNVLSIIELEILPIWSRR